LGDEAESETSTEPAWAGSWNGFGIGNAPISAAKGEGDALGAWDLPELRPINLAFSKFWNSEPCVDEA